VLAVRQAMVAVAGDPNAIATEASDFNFYVLMKSRKFKFGGFLWREQLAGPLF
jgi:hypothetical protein